MMRMAPREILSASVQALRANPLRSFLTALGMLIGNASVILVVTISLAGRDFILREIEGIGSNLIFAYSAAGAPSVVNSYADYIKTADVEAVREQLGDRLVAATGIMTDYDEMTVGNRRQDIKVNGVDQYYAMVRNLAITAGSFFTTSDVTLRTKAAMLTDEFAVKQFGSTAAAVGQMIQIHGLPFTIIGTFRERVSTYGQSELAAETILIPITILRYFTTYERIDPMYVQVRSPREVDAVAGTVRSILEGRHRPGARYVVDTLTGILSAARQISVILSLVLILVSAIALTISGIGIMNIMLVTVAERTREIGIRMAVGASRREILWQFVAEAVLLSLGGGLIGILVGVGIPLVVEWLGGIEIPISAASVVVAFVVAFAVGLIFGVLPARRASSLDPTEALRYE